VHAVVITESGGPDVLRWAEVPDPVAGPDEVVVTVTASAVNRADLLQRQGLYPPPPGASAYPGLECSGTIAEVGVGVQGWQVGDPCTALLAGGGYAERVTVPAPQLLPAPAGVPLLDAAALPEVACTVWSHLVIDAGVRPGDVVLVHGGAGGIGTFAIQAAVALGARVAVTAGSADKLERCRDLGAEILIQYRDEDFVAAVRDATAGHGADIVLDNMGGAYLARNVEVLATGGRIQVIGLQGGAKGELDLGRLMGKRAQVRATTLRARPIQEKGAICRRVETEAWPLIESGAIRTVIDRVLPMADAAEAHRVVADSEHVGKVLLAV
jgi:putative PIG3 family NAD(P)H quinone oxidoreductase